MKATRLSAPRETFYVTRCPGFQNLVQSTAVITLSSVLTFSIPLHQTFGHPPSPIAHEHVQHLPLGRQLPLILEPKPVVTERATQVDQKSTNRKN